MDEVNKCLDKCLDKLLINNDKLIKNIIKDFLIYKCPHCDKDIFNPNWCNQEGKYPCEKCINYYIFCQIEGCKDAIFNKKLYCEKCIIYYCYLHSNSLRIHSPCDHN